MAAKRLRRIVIADDQPLERLGVLAILKQAISFEQLEWTTSFGDIANLLVEDTDLVVLDDQLPGLTSLEALRQLRVAHPTVKFVLVCADCTPQAVFTGLMAGASGYISKTMDALDMVEAFRLVSMGHVYVPPHLSDGGAMIGSNMLHQQWNRVMQLSARQRQVLQLVCEGASNKEIARKLSISEATVKVHVGAAFRVIGVTNRVHAAAVFRQHRLHGEDAVSEIMSPPTNQQLLPFLDASTGRKTTD
jgi:DNA-binding NarL/FixJ family response regulator